MQSIATVPSPSILKPALVFAAAAAMLVLSGHASAQEPGPAPHAYAGEPTARIRGDKASRIDAVAVADALAAKPHGDRAPAMVSFTASDSHDNQAAALPAA